jgi:hypothetical protein
MRLLVGVSSRKKSSDIMMQIEFSRSTSQLMWKDLQPSGVMFLAIV